MNDLSLIDVISDASGPVTELGEKTAGALVDVMMESPKTALVVLGVTAVSVSYFAVKNCSEMSFKGFKYKAKP